MDKVESLLGLFIWVKARLREPSTMASLCAVTAIFGGKVDPGILQDWMNTLTLLFGALGFFFKEKGPLTKV